MNLINNISEKTENAILRKSAYGLPNRPSAVGMSPVEIKKAFYKSLIDSEDSLMSELRRIVDEANEILSLIDEGVFNHKEDKSNPHNVNKEQVGLANVNNTSDLDKPVSNAVTSKLNEKINISDIVDSYSSIATDKPASANSVRLLDERVEVNKQNIDVSIKTIELNSQTGILTITKNNGSSTIIDLPLEYLVKSGTYNEVTKEIWLELENENLIKIPVADLVNEYYADNVSVSLYTDSSDGNKLKFKISDSVMTKINNTNSLKHNHENKSLLDTYNQSNESLTDAVNKKHSHHNSSLLDGITASFTTEKESQINQNKNDINELFELVSDGGTIIYENGVALDTLHLEEIVYAAFSEIAQKAVLAERCTKGGEIDTRLKKLGG